MNNKLMVHNRLSGTGSVGATVRIYFEKFEKVNIE